MTLEKRYIKAMELAGYEVVETPLESPVMLTFKSIKSGQTIGLDGWDMVGHELENLKPLNEADIEQFETLIHPQNRISYYTKNLGGAEIGEDTRLVKHPNFESALNSYLDAQVDGKSIGYVFEETEHQLASFDTIEMKNSFGRIDYSGLTQNERTELADNMFDLQEVLQKDNIYCALQEGFSSVAMQAVAEMIRNGNEWGSWLGRVANTHRPQDYIDIDITGFSTQHRVNCNVKVVHANEVVHTKEFTFNIDVNTFEQSVRDGMRTGIEEYVTYLKDAVDRLDTDLEYPMQTYAPHLEHSLEEHFEALNKGGNEAFPTSNTKLTSFKEGDVILLSSRTETFFKNEEFHIVNEQEIDWNNLGQTYSAISASPEPNNDGIYEVNYGFEFTIGDIKSVLRNGATYEIETEIKERKKNNQQQLEEVPEQPVKSGPSENTRVFFDMDGVVAVFQPVERIETLYEKGYFRNLAPQQSVIEAIKQLAHEPDIELFIMSAVLSDSQYAFEEKNTWLDEIIPEIDAEHRIFPPCGANKLDYVPGGIRITDRLIDDYTSNLIQWEPPAKGIKLLNGINHTNGTWKGNMISIEASGEEIAAKILQIVKEDILVQDMRPQDKVVEGRLPDIETDIKELKQSINEVTTLVKALIPSFDTEASKAIEESEANIFYYLKDAEPMSVVRLQISFEAALDAFLKQEDVQTFGILINGKEYTIANYDAATNSYILPQLEELNLNGLSDTQINQIWDDMQSLTTHIERMNTYLSKQWISKIQPDANHLKQVYTNPGVTKQQKRPSI